MVCVSPGIVKVLKYERPIIRPRGWDGSNEKWTQNFGGETPTLMTEKKIEG